MFTLYVRAVLLVWLLCCVGVIAALPGAPPLPAPESGLAVCDVPCWAGVEPGRTLMADVPQIVRSHLPGVTVERLPTHVAVSAPSLHIDGFIQARSGDHVSAIRLNTALPLWRLLLLLGPPACMQAIDSQIPTGMVNVFWVFDDVYVMTNVLASLPRDAMTATTLNLWVRPPAFPCDSNGNTLPWPGFAAFTRTVNQ